MNPLLTSVATEVAVEFGSRLSAILSSTRGSPPDARARAISMYVYRQAATVAPCLTELGRVFDRDRTTVRHALQRVAFWAFSEPGFNERLARVQQRVAEKTPGGAR